MNDTTIVNEKLRSLAGLSTRDMLDLRKSEMARTLNDDVEAIHTRLWDNEKYRAALDAVYDEQAIEGSLACDNFIAAGMIRDYAHKENVPRVKAQKLASLVKSLGVVLRRYGMSRKERARMLGGEIQPNGESEV